MEADSFSGKGVKWVKARAVRIFSKVIGLVNDGGKMQLKEKFQLIHKGSGLEKIGLWLLYFSVTLEIIIVIIDKSNYTNPLEGQLFRITFLLAAGKALCTKYSLKEWAAMVLFGILGLISYKVTGRNEILRIVVFVAACKGTDVKRLLKYVFYLTTAGCLLLVFLSVTGIYGGLALETDFGRGYRQVRYCLGLGHPNALHCMFMMLVLLWLYLYHEKVEWYGYLVLLGMNYGLYLLTDSNTGMLITACGIIGGAIMYFLKRLKEKKWPYVAGALLLLACVGFSVMAADAGLARPGEAETADQRKFGNPLVQAAEEHLNGRIIDLHYGSIRREGTTATWSMFSRPENQNYFDMGIVRIFYWYGVIPGSICILLLLALLRQLYKEKDGMGLVMVSVLAVYTVVEAHLVSVYIGRNYILFLMGMYGSSMLGLNGAREEYLWKAYRLLGKMERI